MSWFDGNNLIMKKKIDNLKLCPVILEFITQIDNKHDIAISINCVHLVPYDLLQI